MKIKIVEVDKETLNKILQNQENDEPEIDKEEAMVHDDLIEKILSVFEKIFKPEAARKIQVLREKLKKLSPNDRKLISHFIVYTLDECELYQKLEFVINDYDQLKKYLR